MDRITGGSSTFYQQLLVSPVLLSLAKGLAKGLLLANVLNMSEPECVEL